MFVCSCILTQCCINLSHDTSLLQLLSLSRRTEIHSIEIQWTFSLDWFCRWRFCHYVCWHEPIKTWDAESAAQQILHCPTYECLIKLRDTAGSVNVLHWLYTVFFSAFHPPLSLFGRHISPPIFSGHICVILHSSHLIWLYFHEFHIFCMTAVCPQWSQEI